MYCLELAWSYLNVLNGALLWDGLVLDWSWSTWIHVAWCWSTVLRLKAAWGHVTWCWNSAAIVKATWGSVVVIAVTVVIAIIVSVLKALWSGLTIVAVVTWLVVAAGWSNVTLIDAIVVEIAWSRGDWLKALNGRGFLNYR